jgi:hypothetical protein
LFNDWLLHYFLGDERLRNYFLGDHRFGNKVLDLGDLRLVVVHLRCSVGVGSGGLVLCDGLVVVGRGGGVRPV